MAGSVNGKSLTAWNGKSITAWNGANITASGGGGGGGSTFTPTFVDSFDRADASPMSTTASDGHTWTDGPGGNDQMAIVSNCIVGGVGAGTVGWAAVVNTPTVAADQYAECVLDNPGAFFGGVVVRMQSASANGYYLYTDGSASQMAIYKYTSDGASQTVVGLAFTGFTLVAGDRIKLGIVGSTMTVYINGVQTGTTRTDSTYASGQPGVTSESSFRLRSFEAGTIT